MTAYFGVSSANTDWSQTIMNRAAGALSLRGPLHRFDANPVAIVAVLGPGAPLTTERSDSSAWLLGDAFEGDVRLDAAALVHRIAVHDPTAAQGLNGFYLAVISGADHSVTLAGDVLGLLPLFVCLHTNGVLFASEPGLLRQSLGSPSDPDLVGLASILLQGHAANRRTPWRSIRRPDPGECVRIAPDGRLTFVRANSLLLRHTASLGLEEASEAGWRLLRAAARRLASNTVMPGLLLSGGLDSRLVAAAMSEEDVTSQAIISGSSTDIEVSCATGVAKHLRMPILRVDADYSKFPQLAEELAEREGGVFTPYDHSWVSALRPGSPVGDRLFSGLGGDAVLGGSTLPFGWDAERQAYVFENYWLKHCAGYGFDPQTCGELLVGPDAADAVGVAMTELRQRFDAIDGESFQRVWLWSITHRVRWHVVPFAWRLAPVAWPCMPFADRDVLTFAATLPLEVLRERRLQLSMLRREAPALARLPLDRNSYDDTPISPPWHWPLVRRWRAFRRRTGREHRTYYRTFDLNHAGWQAIRRLVPASAGTLSGFDRARALEILPAADAPIHLADGIVDAARYKILLTLLLTDRINDC